MTEDKKDLEEKINQVIGDLDKLDTAAIEQSDKSLFGYAEVLSKIGTNPEVAIGTEVGHWKIIELLGQGGMSIVYLVERIDEQIQQQAALKIIPNAIASQSMIDRFVRERQILSDLSHNNIAKLYDAGVTDNDIPWFVMELVQGDDILTFADNNQLNTEQRIILFKQVCDALSYAHAHGVIHRDIKPNNLMVNQDKVIKLLDFGIASADEQQKLTMTGAVLGTPGYMSPEQAKGLNHQLDRRSDIFSLGVLLYKLLKKDMPFQAESISEISFKIIHDEPTLMGTEIPVDLQAITFKCLEKKVEKRYQSVKQLNKDLDAYLNGDIISARKITFFGRLGKKIKKHPVISSLISVAIIATVLGVSYGIYQSIASLKKIQLAEKYISKSQEIKAKVRRTHMMPLHNPYNEYKQYEKEIEELKLQIETEHASDSGQAYYALGDAYYSMSKFKEAHEYFLIAKEKGWDTTSLAIGLGLTYSSLWRRELENSKRIKDKKEKEIALEKAKIKYYHPAMKFLLKATTELEQPYYLLAMRAYNDEKFDEAIDYLEKEVEKNPWNYIAYARASESYFFSFTKLANDKGYDLAMPLFDKSNYSLEKAIDIGRSYPNNYFNRCSRSGIEIQIKRLYKVGDDIETIYHKGIKYCEESLIMKPDAFSPWINLSLLHSNFAKHLFKNDLLNSEKILKTFHMSIDVANNGFEKHPDKYNIFNSKLQPLLGLASVFSDDLKTAKQYYSDAINTGKKAVEYDKQNTSFLSDLSFAQSAFAQYLRDQETNELDESESVFIAGIHNYEKLAKLHKSFQNSINQSGILYEYAVLKIKQGDNKKAIELLTKSFDIKEKETPLRTKMFLYIKNYFINADTLISTMQTELIDAGKYILKTTHFMHKVCELKGFQIEQIAFFKEVIKEFIENQWVDSDTFKKCNF